MEKNVRETLMAVMARALPRLLWAVAAYALLWQGAEAADSPSEYQVKAVFLFNFSHFVDWPPQAFTSPTEPFVIGILGTDPFGSRLDETVHGERIEGRPIIVRRFTKVEEIADCQILFIDGSESAQLDPIIRALDHRGILTVSEVDGAALSGVMVQFVTENNRIRLRINVESARAAGLSISSKLLRLADIVGTTPGSHTP
jgi:YfiR/HmsC-like